MQKETQILQGKKNILKSHLLICMKRLKMFLVFGTVIPSPGPSLKETVICLRTGVPYNYMHFKEKLPKYSFLPGN